MNKAAQLISATLLAISLGTTQVNANDSRLIGIGALLEEITTAIDAFDVDLGLDGLVIGNRRYELSDATVKLDVAAIKTQGSGELDFGVVTVGGDYSQSTSQTMVLQLSVPDDGGENQSGSSATEELLDLLLASVEEIAVAMEDQDLLQLDSITVSTTFEVVVEGNTGFTFRLFGFGGEAGVSREVGQGHEILLSFTAQGF